MVIRIALIQLRVFESKEKTLHNAVDLIRIAKKEKEANVVVLPESFNCPYSRKKLEMSAEEIPFGETCQALSKAARDFGVHIVGGSIVESCCGQMYSTCTVWGPEGELVVKHRKVHLCDANIPGKLTVEESKLFSPGQSYTTFYVGETKIGLGICWDVRFPEFTAAYRQLGCDLLICPAVCDVYTGEMHYELLAKARALDNQMFVALCSPARDPHAELVAYGHSIVVDPWGKVLQKGTEFQEIITADLILKTLPEAREQIPVLKQKRSDMYELVVKK
ncbi:omega-amidase NIT2-like [Toxorhynchites rutilus septentrionalis]|uniref:omega-amidase NIT2-like n=1 Tax=Toxorhynchites rutilus septentrionalis TaxID=329112 RepID=UPI00247974FB|nr:omega-amidase NIT2-like [Toxorhynchites rutilus septentrionalis]